MISTLLASEATSKLTMMSWGLSQRELNVGMIPRDLRARAHQGNWHPQFPRNVADFKQAHT
jgi:hypothetical protein